MSVALQLLTSSPQPLLEDYTLETYCLGLDPVLPQLEDLGTNLHYQFPCL